MLVDGVITMNNTRIVIEMDWEGIIALQKLDISKTVSDASISKMWKRGKQGSKFKKRLVIGGMGGAKRKKGRIWLRKVEIKPLYLGHLAHHFPADHQSLNEGTRSHKCACDHHLHDPGGVCKGPQCLYLLGYTLQVVLACNQHTHSFKSIWIYQEIKL